MDKNIRAGSWASILGVVGLAFAVVISVDIMSSWLAPSHHLREVEDAIVEFEASDPRWLVLGSSHARTFSVVGKVLSQQTGGRDKMLSIPVEFGKMTSYEWVLNHRLRPLLEEKDSEGKFIRTKLRQVLIVTEWWDSVAVDGGALAHNLPARAWSFSDFFKDVWQNGLTSYNQNYVRNRWMRWGRSSTLMSDRGYGQILKKLREKVRPLSDETKQHLYKEQALVWQKMVEGGHEKMLDKQQMAAFLRILQYFKERGVQVSVLLYPRMPITITKKAKSRTLNAFASKMQSLCLKQKVRMIDLSYQTPLSNQHFTADFDHVTQEGNEIFTHWGLKGSLAFLLPNKKKKTSSLDKLRPVGQKQRKRPTTRKATTNPNGSTQ